MMQGILLQAFMDKERREKTTFRELLGHRANRAYHVINHDLELAVARCVPPIGGPRPCTKPVKCRCSQPRGCKTTVEIARRFKRRSAAHSRLANIKCLRCRRDCSSWNSGPRGGRRARAIRAPS